VPTGTPATFRYSTQGADTSEIIIIIIIEYICNGATSNAPKIRALTQTVWRRTDDDDDTTKHITANY